MKKLIIKLVVLLPLLPLAVVVRGMSTAAVEQPVADPGGFTGTAVCKECHESFHELWSTSHHGLAMQPITAAFIAEKLTPQESMVEIGAYRYQAKLLPDRAYVQEWGPDGEKQHPMVHAMGGKNVFFFLTSFERGRLQTLPLAYDVHDKRWYDMAASAVRHFSHVEDEALDWREPQFTFNTSCYGCHVSQLNVNYDLASDTYNTVWAEPGINCETCHGPGQAHVETCRAAGKGNVPDDLKLIVTSTFNQEQTNDMCSPCHAKMSPLSTSYTPGDPYFDNFDLVTFEDNDFYPDGRDLGENYTLTGWRMNPCAMKGDMDCMHCHTSSGRYRFTEENANDACLPCHEQRVKNATQHTHHKTDSTGNRCINCHMPKSRFAAMMRSDHSLRPPTPSATLEFESPNACNMCHTDKDAAWADGHVREWHKDHDYQAPVLEVGRLIRAARALEWDRIEDMLAQITRPDRDEIFATSFIRLLRYAENERKWPVMIKALDDPSPLVRGAAADALSNHYTTESIAALVKATRDDMRLVRIRAASALAQLPREQIPQDHREHVAAATQELEASLRARPDDTFSHYNLGNFHMAQGNYEEALKSYEVSARLQPQNFLPLVNASLIYNMMGQNDKAEQCLRKAIVAQPSSDAAYLNLALLLAEVDRLPEAEEAFRGALKANPRSSVAAYNLGVLLLGRQDYEGIRWCRRAAELDKAEPKYAYTLAYALQQFGEAEEAVKTLEAMVEAKTSYAAAYSLLAHLHEQRGNPAAAISVYEQGLKNPSMPEEELYGMAASLQRLKGQ